LGTITNPSPILRDAKRAAAAETATRTSMDRATRRSSGAAMSNSLERSAPA
jgi:hypothetical protein